MPSEPEAIVDPQQRIIDAHHHLFPEPMGPYPAYPPEALIEDLDSGHDVRATVYMEAGRFYDMDAPAPLQPAGETRRVDAVAEAHADRKLCAAIVAHADLTLGDAVDRTLDAHGEAAPRRFRGVRHNMANLRGELWSDPVRLLEQPVAHAALRRVARRGLVFETMPFHFQLGTLAQAACAHPDLTIVVNHFGGPLHLGPYAGRKVEVFEDWKRSMTALADAPNVLVKLGGCNMWTLDVDWGGYPGRSDLIAEATGPYFHHVVEAFGPERCVFESNFPVDRVAASYAVTWNAFKKIAAGYSADEKAAMFHDNAARLYGIG